MQALEETLKQELAALEEFRKTAKANGISLIELEVLNAEKRIFDEFISEDEFARFIAKGSISYSLYINRILNKFNSFWKRIWKPRKDNDFNIRNGNIITSMNNVGVGYADPKDFTTGYSVSSFIHYEAVPVFVGGLIGIVAYSTIRINSEVDVSPDVIIAVLIGSLAYFGIHTIINDHMKEKSKILRTTGKDTEIYLRQLYARFYDDQNILGQ